MHNIVSKEPEDANNSNSILKMISNIMSDQTFRNLFDEHFNNWDDVKAILMIMKVYQLIDVKCKEKGIKLTNDEMIFAVKTSMNNSSIRNLIRKDMTNFIECDKNFKDGNLEQIINITSEQFLLNKSKEIRNDKLIKDN